MLNNIRDNNEQMQRLAFNCYHERLQTFVEATQQFGVWVSQMVLTFQPIVGD